MSLRLLSGWIHFSPNTLLTFIKSQLYRILSFGWNLYFPLILFKSYCLKKVLIHPQQQFSQNFPNSQKLPKISNLQQNTINIQIQQMITNLIITTLLISINLSSATIVIPYNDPNIHFHGRHYTDQNGLRFDWPCSSVEICFVNVSKITWVGVDTFGHYKVMVNDKVSKEFVPKRSTKLSIYQNTQSEDINCMKIIKITEDHYGPLGTKKDALFKCLELEGNGAKLVKKQENYKYELQFVGDSITSAFGDLSGRNPICFLRMRHNQDCTESWATHLAAKLNAGFRIQAQSGKGVAKNAFGVPAPTMPVLYSKITSNSKPDSYSYQDKYSPDAIIFSLGDNDYSSLIKPSDDYFVFMYSKMLSRAVELQRFKAPKIIGICYADSPRKICQNVKQAIKSFHYSYKDAYYVEVPQGIFIKQNLGCIGHLNAQGQKKMAESVYEKIKQILQG